MRPALAALLLTTGAAVAHGGPHARLPLGDGRLSAEPRRGHAMPCRMTFPGGGGAHRTGDWIADGTWDPAGKPNVEGNVAWPGHVIAITVEGDRRIVRANNLPDHPTGEFPIRPGSAAHAYDRNPHRIAGRPILLTPPAAPRVAETPTCVPLGMIGLALSGAAIYNAFDVRGRDAPAYEIQDRCNGHPERDGQYHYHDWSPCLDRGNPDEPVGWMLDGFPILGPRDAAGGPITNADLDECHGRVGPVRGDGRVVTTCHGRFTREFPSTIGCFRGTVDASLLRPAGPPGRRPPALP